MVKIEINWQLIEQLKAKQAETLSEWIRLKDKHKKTEKLINDLIEHMKTEEIKKSAIDDFTIDHVLTTASLSEADKKSKKNSLYQPKPIFEQKSEISSIALDKKENLNKCLNQRNGIYRDQYNCSSFYICEEISPEFNQMRTFKCPEGLEFNMEMCTCVSFFIIFNSFFIS